MRLLIGGFLIVLGAIFGVMYDQNMAVLPLQREIRTCNAEKDILTDAFQHMRPNKFKIKDYITDAARRANGRDYPYPGLEYLFMCVVHDNKTDVPTAAELIKKAVDAYVEKWRSLVK